MSRLTQPPVVDGDAINAASINDRLVQFVQSGTLNQYNARDGAIDLPQFGSSFMAPNMAQTLIGRNEWRHSAYNTVVGIPTGGAPHVVADAALLPTVLSLGGGWALTPSDILRVYWDLSVRPRWEGTNPWLSGAVILTFPNGSGGTINISNGVVCWVGWLQWDTTDATLTNWTNVPGQSALNTLIGATGRGGASLDQLQATSVVPATCQTAASPNNGAFSVYANSDVRWTNLDGAWHYIPGGNVTVYGLRVVLSGPFGAWHSGATNYLIHADTIAPDARLDYNAGALQAMTMRVS